MSHHLWRGRCRFCCFLHSGSISMFLVKSKYNQKHNLTYKNNRFNIKPPSVHLHIVVFYSFLTEQWDIYIVKLFHSFILLPVHGIVCKGKGKLFLAARLLLYPRKTLPRLAPPQTKELHEIWVTKPIFYLII